jgi:predicted nucleic acid-binding Zn ribbon protein
MKFWRPRTWIPAVLLFSPTIAGSRENLSGSWREEYEEDIRSVEQWDARCGEAPRSPGRRDRGLVFTVEDRGVELQFASPSGRFSTSDCQSSHPDIRPREMTLKEGLYLKNCSTADDALDYESGLYSFRVISPDRIEYRETTRYSRHTADGALCVHTRRVQRRYSRIAPAEASATEPTAETADAGTAGGEPPDAGAAADDGGADPGDDACRHPGPVRRLRAIPPTANVLVGETFCPRLEGRDASGCVVDVRPDRQPPEPLRGVWWTEDGCLRVTDRAPGGTRSIEIRAQGAATEVQLVILRRLETTPRTSPHQPPPPAPTEKPAAEPEPPDGDAEPSPPPAQEPPPTAPPPQPSPSAPAVSAPSGNGLPLFLALAGAATLLGLVLFVAIRRRSRRPPAPDPAPAPVSPAPTEAPLENLPTVPAMPRARGAFEPVAGGSFCTECGRAIPAGARFCPFDRTPVAGAAPAAHVEKTCPSCGRSLPPSARFCPYDRTPLTEDDPP